MMMALVENRREMAAGIFSYATRLGAPGKLGALYLPCLYPAREECAPEAWFWSAAKEKEYTRIKYSLSGITR